MFKMSSLGTPLPSQHFGAAALSTWMYSAAIGLWHGYVWSRWRLCFKKWCVFSCSNLMVQPSHLPADEDVLKDMLNEITRALLSSDVNVRLVMQLSQNIRKVVDFEEMVRNV